MSTTTTTSTSQPLSGTIVVIIIAVAVQACITLVIFGKRQIQRFSLRNRRGPHASIGHGAPKHLRRHADRLLERTTRQRSRREPPVVRPDDDDFRRLIVSAFRSFLRAELKQHPGGGNSVRSHLLSCCTAGDEYDAARLLVHQVCDEYDAARHHYGEVTRQRYETFAERLDALRLAVRHANRPSSSLQPKRHARHPKSSVVMDMAVDDRHHQTDADLKTVPAAV